MVVLVLYSSSFLFCSHTQRAKEPEYEASRVVLFTKLKLTKTLLLPLWTPCPPECYNVGSPPLLCSNDDHSTLKFSAEICCMSLICWNLCCIRDFVQLWLVADLSVLTSCSYWGLIFHHLFQHKKKNKKTVNPLSNSELFLPCMWSIWTTKRLNPHCM